MLLRETAVLARATLRARQDVQRVMNFASWCDPAALARASKAQAATKTGLVGHHTVSADCAALRRNLGILFDAAETCDAFQTEDMEAVADIVSRLRIEAFNVLDAARQLASSGWVVTVLPDGDDFARRRFKRLHLALRATTKALDDLDAMRHHAAARVW